MNTPNIDQILNYEKRIFKGLPFHSYIAYKEFRFYFIIKPVSWFRAFVAIKCNEVTNRGFNL